MNTSLSIIILQHNTPQHVINNLQALSKANLPTETEVIVINNGGNQANQIAKNSSPKNLDIKFYETPNHGFPTGNNFGLSKANPNSNFYAFINADIQVKPNTISTLIQYMQSHPNVGLTSPTLRYSDNTIQDNYRVFPRAIDLIIKRVPILRELFPNRMRKYLMWDRNPSTNEAVDWVTGAFTILSKACMKAIKKHDEKYFLFMSDVVLCREAWSNNFEVHIVGQTEALHNDIRVSDGKLTSLFKNKIIRIHILDAIKYFIHYAFKPLPANSPSTQNNR